MDLAYDWPFIGLAIGCAWFLAMLVRPRLRDPSWLVALVGPLYMIHQFEEHGIDLRGDRYHFMTELCTTLGHRSLETCPADPAFIIAVNCGAVWIAGLAAFATRHRNPMIGACAWGIPIVNAVAHLGPAIGRQEYNSGVATSLLLFVPFAVLTVRALRAERLIDGVRLAAMIGCGIALHAVLLGSLVAFERGAIAHPTLLAVNVANGFVPVIVGALLGPARRRAT
jgi:hypothetical protein